MYEVCRFSRLLHTTSMVPTPAVDYEGPGDIVSGWEAWVGLRAFSNATIGQNAVRIVRASDSAEQDFITLADGSVDAASIATFLAATSGKIVTLYDQTGNGRDVTQATDSERPAYNATGTGSLPALVYSGAQRLRATSFTVNQPYTTSVFFNADSTTNRGGLLCDGVNSATTVHVSVANDCEMNAGGPSLVIPQVSGSWHACQFVFNGANSDLYLDGTSNIGDLGGINAFTGILTFGDYNATLFPFEGKLAEGGVHPTDMSAFKAALNTNQHNYWGV